MPFLSPCLRRRNARSTASLAGLLLLVATASSPSAGSTAQAERRVIIIEGEYLGENGLPNQGKSRDCFTKVIRLLELGRVPYVTTRDSLVEQDGLPGGAVVILPYNRAMTQAEAHKITGFINGGGKLIAFFNGHANLLQMLGVKRVRLVETSGSDPLTRLSMTAPVPGAPATVGWQAQHVVAPEALAGASPLAVWQTKSGLSTAQPSLLSNHCGAYFASEPLGMDENAGAALLRAVVGKLAPKMWQAMLPTSPAEVGPLGRFASLVDLRGYVEQEALTNENFGSAAESVATATRLLDETAVALGNDQVERALALHARARATAERAFWASYPPVPGELRGVWMCNYAAPSWRDATRSLSDANINAIFPYMMSGGVAFYRSKVLPLHRKVREHGDYLAEAVSAARAAGVPLHARMLNLTTLFASEETKEALREAGRLMVTSRGKSSDWLCPTHPANRKMEVAAALEMAGYGVQGIQFDYLRYPWKDTCFCRRCRQTFEADCSVKPGSWPDDVIAGTYRQRFADWRREQVTSLVQEISRAVRQRHPRMYISAAVFLNWESHRESFGQDWVEWARRGLVDFVCPMNYTAKMESFQLYVSRQEQWIAGRIPWASGLGVHADGCDYGGPEMVLEQIRVARAHGAKGFVIFNYSQDLVRDYLPPLKQGVTRTPTSLDCPVGPPE